MNVYTTGPIAVTANTTYYFGAWVTSVYPLSAAILNFSINGASIGAPFSPTLTTGDWSQFYVAWNSGAATSATISLVNQNTAFSGNDFALDDISLSTSIPVPEPMTLALFGAGLAGLGVIRRRRG